MKSFRLAAVTAALMLGAFSSLTYTACNSDKCEKVTCPTGSHCVDGDCVDDRTKFEKTWTAHWVNVADNTRYGDYTTMVSANATSVDQVIIDQHFFQDYFSHTINATVSGNTITIPTQSPDGTANSSVAGSGIYSDGIISWNYTITASGGGATKSYTDVWK